MNVSLKAKPITAQSIWGKFSLRGIESIFPLKDGISSFGNCLNNQISDFQRGDIF